MSDPLIVWLDGRLGDDTSMSVPVTDRGLLIGDGVFETLAIVEGANGARAFALSRHLRRLVRACAATGIAAPAETTVRTAVDAVLEAHGTAPGRLRITTSGSGHLLVTAGAAPASRARISLLTSPWVRNERSPIVGVKSTSYAENAYALRWAQSGGADDAVMANTSGELCESATANVFVGIGGDLLTPPLSSGCLPGVTREILLDNGFGIERTLPIGVLAEADEVFVTNSLRGVLAVHTIDGRTVTGCPGPQTQNAAALFDALVHNGSES